jgi:hypothetical protein
MDKLPRIIYLGGLGRSGSTLIERLLGELPGVCALGEVVHMWRRGIALGERCGCGEPFPGCRFWRQVGEVGFGGWDRVDTCRVTQLRSAVDRNRFIPLLARPGLRPGFGRGLDEYLSYYRRLYAAVGEVSGCDAVVDSSKHASLAFCLRSCPDLDVRVVHVVRDSRAVAHSWTTRVARPDSEDSHMRTYAPVASAAQWNAQNLALHLLAHAGAPTLRVRYEDLVEAPEAALRGIAAFAEIAADEPGGAGAMPFLGRDRDGPWAQLGTAHTASGNPMRFLTGKIPIRQDERWRTAMPAAQRRAVTALTLPLLARYGYMHR